MRSLSLSVRLFFFFHRSSNSLQSCSKSRPVSNLRRLGTSLDLLGTRQSCLLVRVSWSFLRSGRSSRSCDHRGSDLQAHMAYIPIARRNTHRLPAASHSYAVQIDGRKRSHKQQDQRGEPVASQRLWQVCSESLACLRVSLVQLLLPLKDRRSLEVGSEVALMLSRPRDRM